MYILFTYQLVSISIHVYMYVYIYINIYKWFGGMAEILWL